MARSPSAPIFGATAHRFSVQNFILKKVWGDAAILGGARVSPCLKIERRRVLPTVAPFAVAAPSLGRKRLSVAHCRQNPTSNMAPVQPDPQSRVMQRLGSPGTGNRGAHAQNRRQGFGLPPGWQNETDGSC